MKWMRRAAIGLAVALPLAAAHGQDQDDKKEQWPPSFDRKIEPILRRYCVRCHNDDKAKGDVDLKRFRNPRQITHERKLWLTVVDQLASGQMPPEDAPRKPKKEDRDLLVRWIEHVLGQLDCENPDPGPPVTRRLNRTEYDRTVRDLVGLNDLNPAASFPPDAIGFGFDNIGEALSLSPSLVQQYYDAAQSALERVLPAEPRKLTADEQRARDRVIFVRPGKDVSDREAARRVIARFADRAFRRPVSEQRVVRLLKIYDQARGEGDGFEAALRTTLTAVMISPRFLMRVERNRPGTKGSYPVDDHDLAARLSYFLWSSPPDERLRELARAGKLNDPAALERETRRMLADPRGEIFADKFMGQWLELNKLKVAKPNAELFPGFDAALREAMAAEVRLLAREIVREDRPVTDLIDARYTYLNARLAKHYGVDGVTGDAMRRVQLADRRRGGVLTSAALLTSLADPDRTNVPRTGNYVVGTILGTPPPPPPPDVPELESAKQEGKTLTLRQMLELHRESPECAACHAKIDPMGFALQNYDAIGRWRTKDAHGVTIDASGELIGGKKFVGPVGLKDVLLEKKQAFARAMAEKMLIYAIGRGPRRDDECAVRGALTALKQSEYRLSAMVIAIVKSAPFRMRRNPE